MFIVDTNIVSKLRKPQTAAPALLAWANTADPATLYLSVVSVWEIEWGILGKARKDVAQAQVLRHWFETIVLPAYDGRILPVCLKTALACASLHVPDKRPERDSLIAATAIANGMKVVTENESDFISMGCPIINPMKAP